MNQQEFFEAAKACVSLTIKETKNDVKKGLTQLDEKITAHRLTSHGRSS